MLPFNLLFRPPALMRDHPVRNWRDITLWLKWGLLLSIGVIMLRVGLHSDPASISYIFSALEWLNGYHDTISIPPPLQYALFFIIESLIVVLVWLIKSCMILMGYQLYEDIHFDETNIAFSLAGASLVTNLWLIIPYGTWFSSLHGLVLVTYLATQIHRLTLPKAVLLGLAGLVPVMF